MKQESSTDTLSKMATEVGPLTGLAIGRIFAERYEIIRLLGRGGMGAVYLANDREVAESVALKVLEARADADASAVERFRREVRLARRVTHSNAARTYDLGLSEGVRYLTMEYVCGRNLHDLLTETRFDSKQVVSIALQLCAGLGAAHDAGVIHRDLKPENILLENDTGRVVVTDFGIARALESDVEQMRTAGAIGTPAYMAPEQLECKAVDQRTDVYALGLILYQLSTGTHPFLKKTAISTAMARLTETPTTPSSLCDVDATLSALIMEALAIDPKARPPTMQAFAERLAASEAETYIPSPQELGRFASLPSAERCIAVTPFRYRGPKEDQYLAEVLTEELVDIFSMTGGLCVVGPAATANISDESDGTATRVAALGKVHNVDAVVVGTVQKSGDELRIAARLLESPSGKQIWSENFKGRLENVFDLQDRIAKRVAEALRIELVQSTVLRRALPEAVELYLRARQAPDGGNLSQPSATSVLLERCLALEPDFKPALAALARARTAQWFVGDGEDPRALAEKAVAEALRLAPELAESHLASGVYATNCGDYETAARALRKALEIAPTYGDAHDYLGRLQLEAGRPDEGMERVKLAMVLDPTRRLGAVSIAREDALRGDFDACDALINKFRPLGFMPTAWLELRTALWRHDLDRVRATLEQQTDARPLYRPIRLFGAVALGELTPDKYFETVTAFAVSGVSARMQSLSQQVSCEVLCSKSRMDLALPLLVRAAGGALVDLSWLDRCPAIDVLRGESAFAEVRAQAVVRAEAIWSV